MNNSQLSGLNVYASGTYPVELSAGKRISGRHRVPLRASVEVSTGEVRLYVDREAIEWPSRPSKTTLAITDCLASHNDWRRCGHRFGYDVR